MNALSLLLTAAVITQQPAASAARLADLSRLQALLAPSAAQLAGLSGQLTELSRLQTLQAPSALQVADLARLAAAQVEWSAMQLAAAAGLDFEDQQDPGDSLWRAARRAFNRGEYASAANLFDDIPRRYADSRYAGDAHYWGAFSLYRVGDDPSLRRALTLLDTQKRRYPQARTTRDASTLRVRILTALARRGDQASAAELSQQAQPAQPVQPTQPVEPVQPPAVSGGASRSATTCPNEDDDDDIRAQALNGLLQMDAANAVPILKRVLAKRDPCSAGLRRKAVFILSQKRTEDVENILLDVARNDPDQEVRAQAVFWLSQVPSERAVNMLDSILRTSTDEEIQKKAVFALSQQQNPRAGEILRAYAERPGGVSDEVRAEIITWLGQRPGAENAAFLRGLYAKLTDDDLKEKVIFSLSQQGGDENARWLMDLALNEREPIEMRKKALFWVGQSGNSSVAGIAELVGLYDRIQNHEMKEQLIFVYSQRHEPEALDKLIDIVRHEQDKELRKKALFWVGQSHDPRAARLLEEIINQ